MSQKKARPVSLRPLISLDTETQLQIREIRNEESVRKWMYTDHIIGINEHLDWINRLRTDQGQIIFAVLDEDTVPLGMAGVNAIDRGHKKAEASYFLTPRARGGLGGAIQFAIVDFVFSTLGLEKLNCETIEGNHTVVSALKKFCFQEEGFKRVNIQKGDTRLGVHLLGLTRQEWQKTAREKVRSRYRATLDRHPVAIHWEEKQPEASIIDLIQEARSKNNVNWMNVLRLAMDKSPQAAKELVQEIYKTDKEINELTGKVVLREEFEEGSPRSEGGCPP